MKKETSNNWQLTEEGEKIIAEILNTRKKAQERIESMTPPCPVDGLPGKYYKSVGSGQNGRVSIQYRCPNSDIFGWDFNENVSYVIRSSRQGSTPREAR